MKLILLLVLLSCSITTKTIISPQEQVSIKELEIENIWARIDTGAHTSTLHAENIEFRTYENEDFVEFTICHPKFCSNKKHKKKIIDWFKIKSSNGESTKRPVISLTVVLKDNEISADFTLFNRSKMNFPVLLGREFLSEEYLIDPTFSSIK